MSSLESLEKEIGFKKRTTSDLVRYLKTCTPGNPNYSLFLGAGCSRTSSIRSASELIKTWRDEILQSTYNQLPALSELSDQEKIDYLVKNHSSWFDRRNEYSCLFEKRFDLPRQRRIFIENEVEQKDPSIGYAYLIQLVDSGYFKTIFTTNFDDLLTESFYLFSNTRPMVCAHDSSVNSITITSKRPKILKLHGDYLFENIKATLRETESLEENMKSKFAEFAKDYGLIVMGYGGNDRSILDVFDYLLKREDYLKSGLYWCFRKNDHINEEVKKLLWRDKVYYVVIDGFDELMALFKRELLGDKLPIPTSIITERPLELIDKIIDNSFNNTSNSEIIKKDLRILKETKDGLLINNEFITSKLKGNKSSLFDYQENDWEEEDDLKKMDSDIKGKLTLIRIKDWIRQNKYLEAKQEIEGVLNGNGTISSKLRNRLLDDLAYVFTCLGQDIEAEKLLRRLISGNDKIVAYHINLSSVVNEPEEKVKIIDRAIELDPYNARLYHLKSRYILDATSAHFSEFELDEEKIIELLQKSIKINPHIANHSYRTLINLYLGKYNVAPKIHLADSVLNKMEEQDPFSIPVVQAKIQIIHKKEQDKKICYQKIKELVELSKSKKINRNLYRYDLILLEEAIENNQKDSILSLVERMESKYKCDDDFYSLKFIALNDKFGKIKEASEAMIKAISTDPLQYYYKILAKHYIAHDEIEKAEKIISENITSEDFSVRIDLEVRRKNFDEAIRLSELKIEKSRSSLDSIINYGYVLLCAGQFEKARDYLNKYINYFRKDMFIVIINYEISKYFISKSPKKERLEQIIKADSSNMEKAACYLLLGNRNEFYTLLEKELADEKSLKYYHRDWPLFNIVKNEDKFKKLFDV